MPCTLTRIDPGDKRSRRQLCALLEREGISLDGHLDYTCGLFDEEDGQLVATGSSFGPTLRCFAVDRRRQGEGLLNQLVSHLAARQAERGITHLFIYTKCESAKYFSDLGFYEIACVDGAVSFLENRRWGFSRYCEDLARSRGEGSSAAVVMNANPFTLGHRHLVEWAAEEHDWVQLFVLSEEAGPIPFSVRWKLVREGVADLPNVICHASGPYMISRATFPSYFLRDGKVAIRSHAMLDAELFRAISKALGVTARYVGEEPSSVVTGLYNQVLADRLPAMGVQCVIVPRRHTGEHPISASTVRQAIHDGRPEDIRPLVPETTWRYFRSPEAQPVIKAIQQEQNVIHY